MMAGRYASPSRAIEAVAAYVVAESLTNVAKHAGATRGTVHAARAGDKLVVEVTDDGKGGASIGARAEQLGSSGLAGGLAGLADRVAAVDGRLHVLSPPGGPTTIMAELPCGS